MRENTYRRNGKWAKVSGSRGKWYAALGWKDQTKALRVLTYKSWDGAKSCADTWLDF